ncbi:MAG: hypothetical protein ACLUHE_18070 [Christensenellales bacterium]
MKSVDGFTALGQVRLSFPLSFFRKAVYFCGALFILPACFGARAAFLCRTGQRRSWPAGLGTIAHKLCIGSVLQRRPCPRLTNHQREEKP